MKVDEVTTRIGAEAFSKHLVFYQVLEDTLARQIDPADFYKTKMILRNESCSQKIFAEIASFFKDGIIQVYRAKNGKELFRVHATCR